MKWVGPIDTKLDAEERRIDREIDRIMKGLTDHFHVTRRQDTFDNVRWLEAEKESIEDYRSRVIDRD